MNIGEINKGAIVAIMVVLLAAGGYLWHSKMYKPAVAAKAAAQTADTAAQDTLAQAKSKLVAAQKAIEDAKKANSAPDDSVARVQLARKAVPPNKLVDDAAIVLMNLSRQARVRTDFKSGGTDVAATPGSGLSGATPVDLTFEAAGTYQQMMLFMRLIESTVVAEDGKLYARDRLFNVVSLKVGAPDEEAGATAGGDFGNGGLSNGAPDATLKPRKGEILFTVTVRMYTSTTENAQGVGVATPDPAAQPTEAAASGTTTDTSSGATTDPATAGATNPVPGAANTTSGASADTGAAGAAGGTGP